MKKHVQMNCSKLPTLKYTIHASSITLPSSNKPSMHEMRLADPLSLTLNPLHNALSPQRLVTPGCSVAIDFINSC